MENLSEQNAEENSREYSIPGLPLAVYREIVAHLQQVDGVQVETIAETSQQFDYNRSQIARLQIHYSTSVEKMAPQRVERILSYYRDRYARK